MLEEEQEKPDSWTVTWTNTYESNDFNDVVAQATGDLDDALRSNGEGATFLVITNQTKNTKYVVEMNTGIQWETEVK
jgi:thiaminase